MISSRLKFKIWEESSWTFNRSRWNVALKDSDEFPVKIHELMTKWHDNYSTHFLIEPKLFVIASEVNEIQQILGSRWFQQGRRCMSMVLVIDCSHFIVFFETFHFIFTIKVFFLLSTINWSTTDQLQIAVIAQFNYWRIYFCIFSF